MGTYTRMRIFRAAFEEFIIQKLIRTLSFTTFFVITIYFIVDLSSCLLP